MIVKVKGKRGELQERLPDVITVLHKMAGERLEKAAKAEEGEHEDHLNLPLLILDQYHDMGVVMGEKVRKRMLAKMLDVLKGA